MKSTKTWNNISEDLKKQIPKLKRGEVKTFLMLTGVPNPDPDSREVAKEPILYGKRQIRTSFRIWDEGKNDHVNIGAVERWNGDEPDKFIMLVPGMDMGSRFQGKFSLTGGKAFDDELWEFLWLSPEREGTPCKDESVAPLFRLLDFKSETKTANSRFDILDKSIKLVKEITKERAAEVMAALNQPVYQDSDVLMAKVKDLARSQPEQFINAYESEETPVRAIIKSAMAANILDHEFQSGKVKLGNAVITTLKIETSEAFVPAFATWLMKAENGKSVLNNIKNQLEKTKEVNG